MFFIEIYTVGAVGQDGAHSVCMLYVWVSEKVDGVQSCLGFIKIG